MEDRIDPGLLDVRMAGQIESTIEARAGIVAGAPAGFDKMRQPAFRRRLGIGRAIPVTVKQVGVEDLARLLREIWIERCNFERGRWQRQASFGASAKDVMEGRIDPGLLDVRMAGEIESAIEARAGIVAGAPAGWTKCANPRSAGVSG